MKRTIKLGVGTVALVATFGVAGSAFAQEASGEVGMALPGAAPAAGAAAGDSDHDAVIGRVAVGYLGAQRVPFPGPGGDIQAPVVGIRYWIDQMLGLDVGLGIYNDGGSTTVNNGATSTTTDFASRTAVLIHGGVPLSLASEKHYSFQIVPELNVGFSSQTRKDDPVPGGETAESGFILDIGARAGAEIHFGFVGIPQLSLQGGIGVLFSTENVKTTVTVPNAPEQSQETSTNRFTTTVNGEPWDIFTGNIAALYYF